MRVAEELEQEPRHQEQGDLLPEAIAVRADRPGRGFDCLLVLLLKVKAFVPSARFVDVLGKVSVERGGRDIADDHKHADDAGDEEQKEGCSERFGLIIS